MDWNGLKYCAHVAREGSTLAAAQVLKTSQTTVMRRIAALEDALGYELFEKRRTGYVPTAALSALLPQLKEIEAAHAAFEHEAAQTGRSLKGTVRLTAPELLITHFVGSALVAFARNYPEIEVELYTSDVLLDLTRGEADIAIRASDPPTEASLFGRRIAGDEWSICCSKAYAERNGIPRTVDELGHHPVISVIEGRFDGAVSEWLRQHVPKERFAFRHNSLMTIYSNMRAGLGVSPCPDMLSAVDPDIVRCMPLPVRTGKEVWALAPERLRKAQHVRILLNFLTSHLTSALRQAEARRAGQTIGVGQGDGLQPVTSTQA
jgi:DNA-binding transcriptional LysR family regulator